MKKLISVLLLIITLNTLYARKDKTVDNTDQTFNALQHLEVYSNALRELELNYVDTLKHENLLEHSLNRMLYSLDPYTTFIPSSQEEILKTINSGLYGGIGSIITQVDGNPYLLEPYYGMPAQKNGLRAGDEIVEIDGEKCSGKETSEVSKMLRGKPYTTITLKIRREGEKKLIKKSFMRDIIKMETVPYYAEVADGIGYIEIVDFIDRTTTDFEKALDDLVENHGVSKLIIDLRGNGGGLVSEAVNIASLFLPKGTEIVSMKGRHERENTKHVTRRDPKYPEMPLLILVDESSASASELFSGAMQDLDRALIVGERTFGKGLVQTIKPLPYNNYLKVTIAKYYLPSGRCVQAIDYADRQDGERERIIPDSLTREFRTSKGRIVRDGGGVLPDSIITEEVSFNISDYMYVKNIYFKYVNKYVISHPSIAEPSVFKITDEEYEEFCKYVLDQGFTYRLESEKYLQELKKVVKMEGYDDITNDLFDKLTKSLEPNVEGDLKRFRTDIQKMLELEIIKRYYYQKGSTEYALRTDKWVEKSIEILNQKNNTK